jgi:hypothetical protein
MNHSRGSFMIERVWSPSAAPYRQTRIASLAHQMLQTSQQLIAAGKLGGQPGADTAAQGDQLLTAQLLQQAWIACQDNAVCKELDRMFPKAQKITLVCDNLNTHTKGALYATFPQQRPADWPPK